MKNHLSDALSEELPSGQRMVYVSDAMAFIQKHKRFGCTTFDKLQEMYLDKIIYCKPKDYTIVNFVGDRYDFEPSVSLKQEERENWVNLNLVPGKNMNPMIPLTFPTGTLFHKI